MSIDHAPPSVADHHKESTTRDIIYTDSDGERRIVVVGAKPIPLSIDAQLCVLTTEIYNDNGNFEFTNLTEGDYFVSISFNYTDTFSRREIAGTSDIYINGQYTGTQLNTDTFDYAQTENANFKKIVL